MAQEVALPQAELETRSFIREVYNWMMGGLATTGVVAWLTASNPLAVRALVNNHYVFFGLIILEFVLVYYLVGWTESMHASTAALVFLIYSAFNGVTLSLVFLVYTTASVVSIFFITSATFGLMSLYGYTTGADLTSLGHLSFMGLIGVVIASVVNLFLRSPALYWASTYLGILVFVGLTAADTQKLKRLSRIGKEGTEEEEKEAIIGALTLYLDFINLLLLLLRVGGRRR